ncbi:MAG: hypothetical protein R6W68_01900 [Ignavibacteriaceae bacterium]
MKKGCFIKSIIILTIFVGAISYIVQYKLDDWILNPAKKIFIPVIENSMKEKYEFIYDSPEKDSLISFISSFIENTDLLEEADSLKIKLWSNINLIAVDSIVTKEELDYLYNLLEIENER